ncbi:nucleotidyltransferase domain-containing protein [Amycolatopsis sp. FBCC-B4732]|uniref:nucleotidyltransferase domain-containing protein n=1 Tax=Amycolatopsis sp. FBCC-B4732 TaxID=3079339 RepID=UPI001FF3E9DA|nr:nucleotidyltransferase domain-containing protein [Amycolatopsis sp. FBCC-B4732]UOX88017.1 nucleotidyltransferase domain-containing protein [Amycolatopsis sp. FBCC-B4732]
MLTGVRFPAVQHDTPEFAGQDDRDERGPCAEPAEYVSGGVRSGSGDLDLIGYSLRKWMRLARTGNLRANAARIVSRLAGPRFAGYLRTRSPNPG